MPAAEYEDVSARTRPAGYEDVHETRETVATHGLVCAPAITYHIAY